MLLAELVATSTAVAATRSRKAKVAALAETLARVTPEELEVVVSYLGGALLQRRTGLGWRGVSEVPDPADEPSLGVLEVHEAFDAMSRLAGAGSQLARKEAVAALFSRATAPEQRWLQAVVTGNVRQGALDAVTQEAVAQVAGVRWRPCAGPRCWRGRPWPRPAPRGPARTRWPPSASRSAARSCRCSPPARPTWPPRWPACPPTPAPRSPSTPSSTASGSRSTATATRCWS
ncbi:hypothetical protein [Nocardioides okcheonensis]|uniref:hypothetical protein n=1 Tax=Nocardioides okcheonensis TaxID=2894081 RepID=UPI002E766762|nr:hypothetical protein [Nocardioides okcheonensis]